MLEFSWWSQWQAIWEGSICVPELSVAPNILESQLMMRSWASPASNASIFSHVFTFKCMAGNVCASLLLRLRQLISGNLMEPLAWTRYCSSYDGIMSYPKWTSSSTCTNEDAILPYPVGIWWNFIQWRSKLQLDGASKLHAQVGAIHIISRKKPSCRHARCPWNAPALEAEHTQRGRDGRVKTLGKKWCLLQVRFQSLVMSHWCHKSPKKVYLMAVDTVLSYLVLWLLVMSVWRVWIDLKLLLLLSKTCPRLPCFFLVLNESDCFLFDDWTYFHAIQDVFSALSSYKCACFPNMCMNVSNVCMHII